MIYFAVRTCPRITTEPGSEPTATANAGMPANTPPSSQVPAPPANPASTGNDAFDIYALRPADVKECEDGLPNAADTVQVRSEHTEFCV